MGRRNGLGHKPRSQLQKKKNQIGEAFTMFRPLEPSDADSLYGLMKTMQDDGILPPHAELKSPQDMRVTYLERHRFTRQLQGFAAAFNAVEAIQRINESCDYYDSRLVVSLGRAAMLDRRDESLVARLDHSQIVAEEFDLICDALSRLHVPGMNRLSFKPHIILGRIPGLAELDKKNIAKDVQGILPDEVLLQPLQTFPTVIKS